MKREERLIFPVSAVLSFTAALSGIYCIVTAFDLTLANPRLLTAVLCLASVLCAAAYPRRGGRLTMLCLAAGVLGWLLYRQPLRNQCLTLIQTLARVYDNAYGWGIPKMPVSFVPDPAADCPLGILGTVIILTVSRTVCDRRGGGFTLLLVLVPLEVCLLCTDTVPDSRALIPLLTVILLILLTEIVRQESTVQCSRLLCIAALPAAALVTAVFLLIPREGYESYAPMVRAQLRVVAEEIAQRGQGVEIPLSAPGVQQDSIDLASAGPQSKKSVPVLELTSQAGGTVYLRARDYARYTGLGWELEPGRTEIFGGTGEAVDTIGIRTRAPLEVLLMPYYPPENAALVDGASMNAAGQEAYITQVYAPAAAAPPDAMFLALPEQTAAAIAPVLNRIPGSFDTPQAAAEAIGDFVRSSADYNLATAAMPAAQTDFAVWFLEQGQTGYCIHFATAATVLLRSVGVPARYVVGYKADTLPGQAVTVTTDDAHAWAEYYDSVSGTWQVLEATPGAIVILPEEELATAPVTETMPVVHATIPAPGQTEPTQPETPAAPRPIPRALLLIPALLLILPLAEGQRLLRIRLRQLRREKGTPNRQALTAWQEAQLLSRLLKTAPPEELLELAERAAYSRHPLTSRELAPFAAHRRQCREAMLRTKLPRRLVLRYLYAVI